MKVVRTPGEVREQVSAARSRGTAIGLVPTMGYFHEGHLSLMRLARQESGFCVVSLFVNPTQFGPGEDLASYPRDFDRDLELAGREGVDLLFAPEAAAMYRPGTSTYVEETSVSRGLCGKSRPGHFRGVATVVTKLFNIVAPDLAIFGRKDLQQLMLIRRMVRDLDLPVRIIAAPIVREPDGLALSSRNVYLSPAEREKAPRFHLSLLEGARDMTGAKGEVAQILKDTARRIEERTGGTIDFVSAVDEDMQEVSRPEDCRYLAGALFLGRARLIDNVRIGAAGELD